MSDFFRDLETALLAHGKVAVATVIHAQGSVPRGVGAKMLVFPNGQSRYSIGGGIFESLVIRDALEVLRSGTFARKIYSFNEQGQDAIGAVCGGVAEVIIEMVGRTPGLMVIGGGHVGQAIVRIARAMDYRITLIDDRAEYARTEDGDPGTTCVHVSADYHDMPRPEPDSFVCLVSKGYLSDEAALRQIIRMPVRYIGMIGSQKKIQKIYERMQSDGFEKDLFDRIHAPIGLEIGADSPEEIAVSVMAQIISLRRRRE